MPSPRKFKRLIIDPATGKFLAPGGQWTADEEHALDFTDLMSAIIACATLRTKTQVHVLLRFREGKQYDIRLTGRG